MRNVISTTYHWPYVTPRYIYYAYSVFALWHYGIDNFISATRYIAPSEHNTVIASINYPTIKQFKKMIPFRSYNDSTDGFPHFIIHFKQTVTRIITAKIFRPLHLTNGWKESNSVSDKRRKMGWRSITAPVYKTRTCLHAA